MKQVYHSNAVTNVRLRCEINNSKLSNKELTHKYGVSDKTINKWKNRDVFEDKSSRPNIIKYALSNLEMLIAINLRGINLVGFR